MDVPEAEVAAEDGVTSSILTTTIRNARLRVSKVNERERRYLKGPACGRAARIHLRTSTDSVNYYYLFNAYLRTQRDSQVFIR